MQRLKYHDLHLLQQAFNEVNEIETVDDLPRSILASIKRIVPSESTIYNEFTPTWQPTLVMGDSTEFSSLLLQYMPALEKYLKEHPFVTNFTEETRHGVYKVSDFTSKLKFQRLGLYNEYYRHIKVDFQIAFEVPVTPSKVTGYIFNRKSRDFSERDRSMLALMKPLIVKVYRNLFDRTCLREVLFLLEQTSEDSGLGVILIDPNEKLESCNKKARQYFSEYFGSRFSKTSMLPSSLKSWLQKRSLGYGPADYVTEKNGKQLRLRCIQKGDSNRKALVISERKNGSSLIPNRHNLSPREAEVLQWLARGKTNVEIGLILGISHRTVQKHLEHVFNKLGVENRTAAATAALAL